MDHHDVLRPVRRALKQFESERVETPNAVTASWTFRFEVWEDPDGGWGAECIELPGCIVQGDTIEELKMHMQSAVQEILTVRLGGQGDDVPDLSGLKVAAAQ